MSVDLRDHTIVVVGAGPVGCLMSALLARRGARVLLYEKRPDMRRTELPAGRSINLVLTERGLRGLALIRERARVVEELTVPVLGRMMHDQDGSLAYQPYGKDDSEHNHSVSRGQLNAFLLDEAEEAGVRLFFEHDLRAIDLDQKILSFATPHSEDLSQVQAQVIIGADGAPSRVRRALMKLPGYSEQSELMTDGYKEIPFPATAEGEYAMASHALHIWPRGHHMLMALANLDGSFTGTVYLPLEGPDSFAELDTADKVRDFFQRHYPDSLTLAPDLVDAFLEHPVGTLGTVRCAPWHREDDVLLIGDAAHAIVPFFGQGLNSGFEDCDVLNTLLERGESLGEVFARFYELRKTNADAIAQLALENYVEMSEKVGDERFLLRKKVERRIEQQLEHLYRSRYATVMYSHIPYRDALDAGLIQDAILEELLGGITHPDELDMALAERLIREKLTPFYRSRGIDIGAAL